VFDAETDNRRKLGQAWEAWGVHHGAKTEFVLDESIGPPLGTIAERISDLASKIQADAIALASRTGPIASSLIGSTTRQVVRISPCPVWVLHYTAHAPHSRAPARKEAA
jgi:nucleotide-binding universal stress UspA family protein